ncbi:MAG: nucleoside-diphosphate sugar epimerase/dehydratase, partial [Acidobacteria bacterium]|nr:nucleoside-diphosphate sugar epimerase/dehydratase [Acidobacteriota bacterium]
GGLISRDLRANPSFALDPVGFLDDDPQKRGQVLRGLPVVGTIDDLASAAARVGADEVVIAMPSASGTTIRRVVAQARAAGLGVRTTPSALEILNGRLGVSALRPVRIEDLLRREPVKIDLGPVDEMVADQVVLVTGAGGSIGSELSRQLAARHPRTLVLLGHGENSIFAIDRELRQRYPRLDIRPVIADVRDRRRLRGALSRLAPGVIFHAAAHKHVPLMEENVVEAVTNNVLGTQNVAEFAVTAGTTRMVLVSTDKAVRPTNVMGATKRVAEQLVQGLVEPHQRKFIAVRFGNVLGSRGSVVPLFLQQIEAGGPVTVTHPEMRRYFMTIPESVSLMLQAAARGQGGDVFVLDMGEPVRIVDLATDLIRLSGLKVGRDIQIEFTGVRPGEKLHEELFFGRELAAPTEHARVLRAKLVPLPIGLSTVVRELIDGAHRGVDDETLRRLLVQLVPDYHPELSARSLSSVRNEHVHRAVASVPSIPDGSA